MMVEEMFVFQVKIYAIKVTKMMEEEFMLVSLRSMNVTRVTKTMVLEVLA